MAVEHLSKWQKSSVVKNFLFLAIAAVVLLWSRSGILERGYNHVP